MQNKAGSIFWEDPFGAPVGDTVSVGPRCSLISPSDTQAERINFVTVSTGVRTQEDGLTLI